MCLLQKNKTLSQKQAFEESGTGRHVNNSPGGTILKRQKTKKNLPMPVALWSVTADRECGESLLYALLAQTRSMRLLKPCLMAVLTSERANPGTGLLSNTVWVSYFSQQK